MRLFRQQELGNWQPVFERMADAVHELVTGAIPGKEDAAGPRALSIGNGKMPTFAN
jgi:hypothetical protein